jgi:nucleoside permease NupC
MSYTVSDIKNRALRRAVLVLFTPLAVVIGIPLYTLIAAGKEMTKVSVDLAQQVVRVWCK